MAKWFIKNNDIDFKRYIDELNVNPVIAKILANREIKDLEDVEQFLYGDLKSMHSPDLMLGVKEAGLLIKENIDYNKTIRVVGDYDVDGIISTYILTTVINDLGGIVDYHIPNRVDDGYGINKEIIKKAYDDNVSLIITCDNGIQALEEVEYAKQLGIDIIITDHHDLAFIEKDGKREYILPNANVVVNPKNFKCKYPFKNLCGASVAYKLLEYLSVELFGREEEYIYSFLEYVSIATIADVVELKGENRIIVRYGLKLLNETENLGLLTLIKELELKSPIGVYHVGFIIGPTLNATGRLDTADKGVELLKATDKNIAYELSKELKYLNETRKKMTEMGINDIIDTIEGTDIKNNDIIVVYNSEIHESIAGIIAGRIKDKYYRPTIVLTDADDGGCKGSARSIEEYNIFEGLTECKSLLSKFGGHPMAAGLSLEKENIDKLRSCLNEKSNLSQDDLTKKYYIDLPLPLDYVSFDLIYEIGKLEPYGVGNPRPSFGVKNVKINRLYKLGRERKILKFDLETEDSIYEGILFNNIEEFEENVINKYGEDILELMYKGEDTNFKFDIIFNPNINEFRGRTSIQIIIEHYRM